MPKFIFNTIKNALVVLILPLSFFANGQCKYISNEFDEFSGQQRVITKTTYIRGKANEQPFGCYLAKIDTTRFIVLEVFTSKLDYVDTESEVIFLFDDKSKLSLPHVGKMKSSDMGHHNWNNKFWLYLDENSRNELASKTIDKVRFKFKNSYKDQLVNKKSKPKIQNIINCI